MTVCISAAVWLLSGHISPVFGYSIIWWNGLFGFGVGCTISWLYYLSGQWQIGAQVAAKS